MDISFNTKSVMVGGERQDVAPEGQPSVRGAGQPLDFGTDNLLVGIGDYVGKAAAAANKSGTDILLWMFDQRFECMKKTIENLAPSEEEIKLREEKQEEVQEKDLQAADKVKEMEELRKRLASDSIEFDQKLVLFRNSLDPDDVKFFEDMLNAENPQIVA